MMKSYTPVNMDVWQGRADALAMEYVFQHIQPLDLNLRHAPKNGYALLGFACDVGVKRNLGRPGASEGPEAFRQAFAKLPIQHAFPIYDAGTVSPFQDDLESAQTELGKRVNQLLQLNLTPIVIGGGHETAFGHFLGLENKYTDLAILNFDAHFDTRPLIDGGLGSSGTPFRQIKDTLAQHNRPFHYYCAGIQPLANTKSLFNYAEESHIQYITATSIHAYPEDMQFIEQIIEKHAHIYLTVCLDVLQASSAPGVSAPQPFGISPHYLLHALTLLKQSKRVVSLDIVELAPQYDINQITAKLAAILLLTYLNA